MLFICNENRLRSPIAQRLYSHRADIETRSAGINKTGVNPVTEELLDWADVVFVMERRQRNIIHKKWPELYENKSIVCLYIDDEYDYMDPVLIRILTEKLSKHLGKPDFPKRTK